MKPLRTFLTLFGLLACTSCSERVGGISSSYPAKDFDPRLTGYAQSAAPVIEALDSHQKATGVLPGSLDQLSSTSPVPPGLAYVPQKESYSLYVKLGWDPALRYDSSSRTWTFDP